MQILPIDNLQQVVLIFSPQSRRTIAFPGQFCALQLLHIYSQGTHLRSTQATTRPKSNAKCCTTGTLLTHCCFTDWPEIRFASTRLSQIAW